MIHLGHVGPSELINALKDVLAGNVVLTVCSLSYIQFTMLCFFGSGRRTSCPNPKTKLSWLSTNQPFMGSFVVCEEMENFL